VVSDSSGRVGLVRGMKRGILPTEIVACQFVAQGRTERGRLEESDLICSRQAESDAAVQAFADWTDQFINERDSLLQGRLTAPKDSRK
jgi:hypothetical protein